jgi:hypothetical protein
MYFQCGLYKGFAYVCGAGIYIYIYIYIIVSNKSETVRLLLISFKKTITYPILPYNLAR